MGIERWRPRWSLTGSPFHPLGRMEREMEEMVERFGRGWPLARWWGEPRGVGPMMDMVDRKDEVVVRADLPGLQQKDVEVTVEGGILTIRGERQEDKECKEEDYYCCERWTGAFTRSLTLPPGVEAEHIRATFRNGVLEVHVPKTKEAKRAKVDVKVE